MTNKFFKKTLYLYAFFSDFFLVFAIDKLIFKETGLSLAQIAIIVSAWGAVQLLVEIPSGILADKWNRKYMLALTGFFFFLCYLTWIIFPSFFGYLIGFSLFYALGEAFLSGTDQAYIYDYLAVKGNLNDYEKTYGLFKSIRMAGVAFAWLLGGFLSDVFSYEFVIVLAAISGFTTFILGLLLPKIPQTISVKNQNQLEFFKDSFIYAYKNHKIFTIFIWSIIIGSSYRLLDEYWAVYYNWFGFSNTTLGILVFISAITGSTIGGFVNKFKNNLLKNINILSFILTIIIILAGLYKSIFIIPFLMLLEPLVHLIGIMSDSLIQRNALADKRSTIASTNSFLKNVFLITGLFFGWIVDLYSVQKGYLFIGLLCFIYFGYIIFSNKRFRSVF